MSNWLDDEVAQSDREWRELPAQARPTRVAAAPDRVTPWPRSILPQDRDGRFNWMADFCCTAYREMADDEVITQLLVTVINGQGQAAVIVEGRNGMQRIILPDPDEVVA